MYSQLRRNDIAITSVLGSSFAPRYVRAPYGSVNQQVLQALTSWGYTVVWANAISHDTDHATGSVASQAATSLAIYKSILDASNPSRDSFISLNHDQLQATSTIVAAQLIIMVRNYGYRLVSIGQCLQSGDWYRNI